MWLTLHGAIYVHLHRQLHFYQLGFALVAQLGGLFGQHVAGQPHLASVQPHHLCHQYFVDLELGPGFVRRTAR